MGALYHTITTQIYQQLLAGQQADAIYPEIVAMTKHAFALLEAGVGSYGEK